MDGQAAEILCTPPTHPNREIFLGIILTSSSINIKSETGRRKKRHAIELATAAGLAPAEVGPRMPLFRPKGPLAQAAPQGSSAAAEGRRFCRAQLGSSPRSQVTRRPRPSLLVPRLTAVFVERVVLYICQLPDNSSPESKCPRVTADQSSQIQYFPNA